MGFDMDKILFTTTELTHMGKNPFVLSALADYHDTQVCEGEAMGFDCSVNATRARELRTEANRLAEEWGIDL